MEIQNDNLWVASCQESFSAGALEGPVEVDLVVIGGGYTGLSAALRAAEKGLNVAVLEARSIGHGGSGRNVGLANAGLWLPPEEITKRLGKTIGDRLNQMLGDAPETVFGLIDRYNIDCNPVRNGTLHCAHSARGFRDLQERFRQQQDLGAPVELLNADEARARVGSVRVSGALHDHRAGTIQPLAYAKGLARAAVSAGARVFENSPALSLGWETTHWEVATPQGRVKAAALIQATNAYVHRDTWVKPQKVIPVYFFQAATEPLPDEIRAKVLPGGEGCWDTATVMSSYRLDDAGRLVIGGMGQLNHVGSRSHASWARRKTVRMFPALKGVKFDYLWHGRIGMTEEYLPKIQRLGPNGYACFGYSGRGIGPGTLFGQHVVDALIDGSEEVLPVVPVDAQAIPFRNARAVFYETGATLTHMVKDRF